MDLRTLATVIATLVFALTVPTTVSGQSEGAITEHITFRLTIHGNPAPGDTFSIDFAPDDITDMAGGYVLCGHLNPMDGSYDPSAAPCRGGGTIYTFETQITRHKVGNVRYSFARSDRVTGGGFESEQFLDEREFDPQEGPVISADYTYPSADPEIWQGEATTAANATAVSEHPAGVPTAPPGEMPDAAPAVGGGGITGAGKVVTWSVIGLLALVLAGGYGLVARGTRSG